MTVVSTWIPSPNHSSRHGHKIDLVVLHYTGGNGDAHAVGRLFNNPRRHAASHYGVSRDGTVAQYVSETRAAWHAGDGLCPADFSPASLADRSRWLDNVNRRSIGIEICNRGFPPSRPGRARVTARHRNPHDDHESWEAYPEAQMVAVESLVREIVQRHGPALRIIGHEDVTNFVTLGRVGSKVDPGPAFDWGRICKATGLERIAMNFEAKAFEVVR